MAMIAPLVPTIDQSSALQAMYDRLNEELFNSELPNCVLNFSREGSNVMGFFAAARWINAEKSLTDEISLNPRSPVLVTVKDVVTTIVHEMCHLWQHHRGAMKSRPGYHNSEWAEKMESLGLCPSATGRPGGKKTGQKMSDYLVPGGKLAAVIENMRIQLPWLAIESIVAARDRVSRQSSSAEDQEDETRRLGAPVFEFPNTDELPQPPHYDKTKVKYSCPNCNLNVWGKPDLALICGVCGAAYVPTVQPAKLFKAGNS